ncbi:MAG: cytochrome c biogenesis protein CcsA [Acidobacteria bacterium]|nr:cytochrome c biogenesis protein CcsA [Acidobacteriota bacterium]
MSSTLLPLVLYAAACVAYAVHFVRLKPDSTDVRLPPSRAERASASLAEAFSGGGRSTSKNLPAQSGRLATTLLAAAALVHTFVIGMQTMEAGHLPVAGATSAISTFVWLLALAYLYTEMTTNEQAMGVFIVPLLVLLYLVSVISPTIEPQVKVLESRLFAVHVGSLLFAYASFALAFVLGLTYVLLFKEIKAKHLGFFYVRLPSLTKLDDMNVRAVRIGWAFLTVGVVAGAIWIAVMSRAAETDPTVPAVSLEDPKILVTLALWAVYSFELYARRAIAGWSGRRSAWVSAIGFVIVLLNFVPVSYFFTTSHNF